MSLKSVIIVSNENVNNYPVFVQSCDNFHAEGLESFCNQIDLRLPIELQNVTSSHILAKYLVSQGFVVMLYDKVDDIQNLIVYIPLDVSVKQYKYFESRKRGLLQFDLSFYALMESGKLVSYDNSTSDNVIDDLMRILNERIVVSKTRK